MRNIIFVLVLVTFILVLIIMNKDVKSDTEIKTENKPMISLSTYSLYDITRHIAQDTLELVMIMPFGVDAHSFEPTPKLMAKIHDSALVIYSGAGLEPWIDGFDFKNLFIDMSQHVKLRELDSDEHNEYSHKNEHEHGNRVDPHYWLDIDNMIIATNIIANKLIKIIPAKEKFYTNNKNKYIDMLKALDSEYKKELSTCHGDSIVVNHNAFSYLSHKYGFKVESLSGLSPEAEPSAKNMIKLIQHVKEHNISTIFFESFVSDRAMKSIAKETGTKVEVIQPLGNITADEAKQKLSFEDIMRDNLGKISKALDCQ